MLTHAEIKRELHYRDSSFSEIGRELGLSRVHVRNVSLGTAQSERVKGAIAKVLSDKYTYQEIWGEANSR